MIYRAARRGVLAPLPFLLALPGVAQSALVESGDSVPGVGLVTRIDEFAINDAGEWVLEVVTDHPDEAQDQVVLQNGSVIFREGQTPDGLPGATADFVHIPYLDNAGGVSWRLHLLSSLPDDTALYLGDQLLFRENDLVGSDDLPATAAYGPFDAKSNGNGKTLVLSGLRNGGATFAVLELSTDEGGAVLSTEVVLRQGDFLPGQLLPVNGLQNYHHSFALNELGDAMYIAGTAVYVNDMPVAQLDVPLPGIVGRWASFSFAEVDLNENRDWVLHARLNLEPDVNGLIVRNGVKLVQEGDALPAIAPEVLEDFGVNAPVLISNGGQVLWIGRWAGSEVGIFIDHELLARQGVTTIDGVVVETLRDSANAFAMSPNGRYVVFEAVLADGTKGAYLIDRGTVASQELRNGSGTNELCLRGTTLPIGGATWTLELDSTGHPGAQSAVLFGHEDPLELPLAFGELLVDVASTQLFTRFLPALGGIDNFTLAIPSNAALLGRTAQAQALILGGTPELCNAIAPTVGF